VRNRPCSMREVSAYFALLRAGFRIKNSPQCPLIDDGKVKATHHRPSPASQKDAQIKSKENES